jgi:hypothetical protein
MSTFFTCDDRKGAKAVQLVRAATLSLTLSFYLAVQGKIRGDPAHLCLYHPDCLCNVHHNNNLITGYNKNTDAQRVPAGGDQAPAGENLHKKRTGHRVIVPSTLSRFFYW